MKHLQKSRVNPVPPFVAEGKAHAPSAPKTKPNSASSAAGHVIVSEGKPLGRNSAAGRFKAPRGEGSSDAAHLGYTKPGK